MTDTKAVDTRSFLADQLDAAHEDLARQWLLRLTDYLAVERQEIFPSQHLLDHIPDLIRAIAAYLRAPEDQEIAANTAVVAKAVELGELRFEQRASIHQLMREYQMFAEILERFIHLETVTLGARADIGQALLALGRVSHAVRVLQQQTVDTFVERYTQTIERQTAQLRSFSRLVSHEIRQPLGVLQVLSRVLPVRERDDETTRLMATLERNVVRLGEVAGKLERLARLTRRTDNTPTDQVVELTGMAREVVHQLADMAATREVLVEVDPNMPSLRLDAGRVELVLINLLANAIKYADPVKPIRTVKIRAVASRPGIALQIADNGIGIPRAKLAAIFDEFVRVHADRDGELGAQGLGLGLSIVQECMEAMGGTVSVESVEGHGTTFTVEWPLSTEASAR
jgi:signal transduction histidine kinase